MNSLLNWRAWVVSAVIFGGLCLAGAEPVEGAERLTRDEVRRIVAHSFPPWAVGDAVAVAECESRFVVDAIGAAGEIGLFQIHPPSWSAWLLARFGGRVSLRDPWANAAAARAIWSYDGGRFGGQWVHCGAGR